MRFRLLGTLRVESGGLDVAPVRPKQRALLALLLLHNGDALSTDQLVDALWAERPPRTAMTALYGHVSELRKRLGAERVLTSAPGYRLRLLDGDELDVDRFAALTASARAATGAARAALLAEALSLFRGEPLAEFRYEPFAELEVARLEELRLSAHEDQLECELELGRHAEAIPRLEALIAEHPDRERLRGQLMLALFRAGRQADALRAFRAARSHLADELGVEPSRGLRELERRILNQDRELAAPGAILLPAVTATAHGPGSWVAVRAQADAPAVRAALAQCGGSVDDGAARGVVAAFARARDAVAGALAVQDATAGGAAIGIHSADESRDGARGAATLSRAARDGQVLVSRSTRDLLTESILHDLELHDAGRHRLDDLGPPWQLFRLAAPGLAAISERPRSLDDSATNLPAQPAQLVGRERELREVCALLLQPDVRVVTLVGPAGVGKTRVAVHAAAMLLADFPDGVFVVDLAPLDDPALVVEAIAAQLGLTTGMDRLERRVAQHLQAHSLLLVVDNFEHQLPVAPAVADLVAGSRSSRLLVTSRVALRSTGERLVAVEPLPPADAARLFAVRARAVSTGFDLTAENRSDVERLCAQLDGLPLAIELAASRAAVLSPRALESRLDRRLALSRAGVDGAEERHRTLQAAIDWSYELLSPECRRVFDALAVFLGGFDLDGAEAVAGPGVPDTVEALALLVDASLVRADGGDEPRFTLLETVRAHAAAKLAERADSGEPAARHAQWFLELAERAEPHLREAPAAWLTRLERESDNLRAALDWLEANDRAGYARLAAALWRFWYLSGRLSEGRRRLERAAAPEELAVRSKLLLGLTVMTGNQSDYAAAKRRAEETLAVSRQAGDTWTAAYATNLLARALQELGDPGRAEALYRESVESLRRQGDTHSALIAARNLALLLEQRGTREQARAQHEENLRVANDSGNPRIEATTLGALAALAAEEGDVAAALPMLHRCLTLHLQAGDLLDGAVDLSRCAFVLARSGDLPLAARLLFVFERLAPDIGARRTWLAARNEQTRAAVDALPSDAIAAAREEARAMTLDGAMRRALQAI